MMERVRLGTCDIADFDRAVRLTGYGKFHYEILSVGAFSIISMGFQNGLSSYAFPAAQCELGISAFEIGLLNMVFMIGGICSCFLWGALADNLGRKQVLQWTHLTNAVVTIVCAVLPNSMTLLVCRFLNGFLVGGPGSIIFSYIAEFQPQKYRSPIVCCCGIFFTISWLILPLLAYLILPLKEVNLNLYDVIILAPWRLFLILLALPEILTGLWLLKMPESPKYFLAKGSHRECLMILRRMYSLNSGEHPDKYPVKNLIGDIKVETHITQRVVCTGKTLRVIKSMVDQMKSLFRKPLLNVTVLACVIMFANMFGMFGLGLWLPEIFTRLDQFSQLHPNETPSIQGLSKLTEQNNVTCEATVDASVMHNTVVMATSSLMFNVFCGIIATKVHFKIIPLVTMLIGGASTASFYFLKSSVQILIVACIFQATMVTANMTIGSIAVELYPTKVVGIGLCLLMCSGRLGAMSSSFLFGYFMDDQCEIPIFVVAIIVLLGGILCFFVPRKNDQIRARTLSTTHGIEVAVISGYDVKLR